MNSVTSASTINTERAVRRLDVMEKDLPGDLVAKLSADRDANS